MDVRMSSVKLLFLVGFFVAVSSYTAMAEASVDSPVPSPETSAAAYIVFTEQPPTNEETVSFYIRKLSSVVSSEEDAKKALIYAYKDAASGFSAMVTPDQASKLKNEPGVLAVFPDQQWKLLNPLNAILNPRRD